MKKKNKYQYERKLKTVIVKVKIPKGKKLVWDMEDGLCVGYHFEDIWEKVKTKKKKYNIHIGLDDLEKK